ncbi:ABC transporter substrate-binding protein [Acidisoma cellulosilytica]|uniref:ABC transporter substrate-binding protein n=1 Tax=Acidisoma cellulosilyticum TaxID=2802395 RepID=A0A963YZC6_9PROT|nr:ABC transporter substrate-binding protein [Acidisoma cellulosilyticum]MCB8879874.1 ABC transporter substrate-binding protein [Acidisoma cellulosilyticum]
MSRLSILLPCLAALLAWKTAQAADLPAAIQSAGKLNLTVNGTYPPMESHDVATNKLVGLDIDLANAIATKLGVKIVWSDVAFAQLIPDLQTGRADMVISGLTDTKAREASFDFIDYFKTGPQFYVQTSSTAQQPSDLCGKHIGTVRSTTFPAELAAWSQQYCVGAGKPAMQYVPAENSPDLHTQLMEGRIDGAVQGSETLPYLIQTSGGKYRTLGTNFATGYQGIAFRKDETQLRGLVLQTLQGLIADGTYAAILKTYNLSGNALTTPTVNGATR